MWSKLFGTIQAYFRIGFTGPRLKASGTDLLVRNAGDSADAAITASKVNISGEVLEINSDAAGAGADWKFTLQRPTSGMTAAVVLTLPIDDGSPNQVLQTDGNGVLTWVSAASTTALLATDTTTIGFGAVSPVTAFTLPANAVVYAARLIVDTAFDGTPSLSVGIAGTTSKYMGATDVDLTLAGETRFETYPGKAPVGTTEAIIITYSAGGASAGSCRVEVSYAVPA